jgi:hypothetical protein
MRKERARTLRDFMNNPDDPFVKHPNWIKNAEYVLKLYESDAPMEHDILLVNGGPVDKFPTNKKPDDVFWLTVTLVVSLRTRTTSRTTTRLLHLMTMTKKMPSLTTLLCRLLPVVLPTESTVVVFSRQVLETSLAWDVFARP